MTKQLWIISLVLGLVGIVVTAFLVMRAQSIPDIGSMKKDTQITQEEMTEESGIVGDEPMNEGVLSLTEEELAMHNNADDCWVLVKSKVYDMTSFIGLHPGGGESILDVCGKDATVAFETRNGKGKHNASAIEKLEEFLLGVFGQEVVIK